MTTDDSKANQEERVSECELVHIALTDLFETIVDTDDRNQRPRIRSRSAHSSNTMYDYEFVISIGPQSAERGNTPETLSASASTDHAVTIYSIDEDYEITLDLPIDNLTDLSTGVDSGTHNRIRWRDRIMRSSLSRRPRIWDTLFNTNTLNNCLYRRVAK